MPYQVLDPDGCLRYEPALAAVQRQVRRRPAPARRRDRRLLHVHAARSPKMAEALGAKFRYGIDDPGASLTDGRRDHRRRHRRRPAAAPTPIVVALGSYSPMLLRPLGIDIPVYPVKGYSITVPITDAAGAPESTIMDETHKVAITRLGDRIRVGGTAELAGYSLHAARGAPRHAGARPDRPLPARRRRRRSRVLVRPAADDARRHAGDRPHAAIQPVPGHRPRHARLDHGGGHRRASSPT